MRSRKLRLGISIGLFVIAIAALGLMAWTVNHKAYLRLRDGVATEIAHGEFLIHVWDTSFYRIEYPPGLSFGDNHEDMWFWAPMLHLNGPPAYYAAPGFHQWVVQVPLWMVSLTAMGAWWMTFRWGWIGGRRKGRCRGCGYDTSGLRSERCPECGDPLEVDIAGVR